MSNQAVRPGDYTKPIKNFCMAPEEPLYATADAQRAMEQLRTDVMAAFDKFESANKWDVRSALALVMIHLADINHEIVAKRGSALHLGLQVQSKEQGDRWQQVDNMAKRIAEQICEYADHNVRLQVKYKGP